MNIVAIVGSIRKDSLNLRLFKTMQERYKEKLNLQLAEIRYLPYFDQDEENDPPQAVKDFKGLIKEADGVLLVTPEYNWSVPGVLKNALDWLSRVDQVLVDKPVMVAGVTPGMLGTIRAQLHLREILASPGMRARLMPIAGNEILINMAVQKYDAESGLLTDETTLGVIDGVMERFLGFVRS